MQWSVYGAVDLAAALCLIVSSTPFSLEPHSSLFKQVGYYFRPILYYKTTRLYMKNVGFTAFQSYNPNKKNHVLMVAWRASGVVKSDKNIVCLRSK